MVKGGPLALLCLLGLFAHEPKALAQEGTGRVEFESGRALFLKGDYQEALPLLQSAYERSGKRPSTILALAKCRQAIGDAEGAIIAYREYLAMIPAPADSSKVEGELDALERERSNEAGRDPEADFLYQGRREVPAEAPLWGETTAPPPEAPTILESPVFWIGLGVLVIALSATAIVLTGGGDGDPLSGTQGVVLHR